MAAIERKGRTRRIRLAIAGLSLLSASLPLSADRAADVRSQISTIATALTAGNPADAMTPFDKSFPNYEKLSNYFQGLNAFTTNSEVDVTDEEDAADETKVTIHWTLTLNDLGSNATERRSSDIDVRLVPRNGKWKIVDFSPISIFDPNAGPAKRP